MRKILSLGKYAMDGDVLGRGNFGRVELATHKLTRVKVTSISFTRLVRFGSDRMIVVLFDRCRAGCHSVPI